MLLEQWLWLVVFEFFIQSFVREAMLRLAKKTIVQDRTGRNSVEC